MNHLQTMSDDEEKDVDIESDVSCTFTFSFDELEEEVFVHCMHVL